MKVTLTPEHERYVNEQIARGRYASADEAVRDGLESLQRREEFQRKIKEGLAELERGEGIPADQAFAEIDEMKRRYLEQRMRKGEAA